MYEFIRSAVAIQVIAAAGAAAALMAVLMFQRGRRAAGKDALSGGTLRRPESRIRATARLGQDKPAGAADQLEPYWYSKDPDGRYFSLYFSSACAARCWRPPSAAGAGRRCFALWACPTRFCSRRPRRAAAAGPT